MATSPTRSALPAPSGHVPRGTPRASKRTRWRALVLILVHLLVLGHILHWWRAGTTISPVEPSEAFRTLAYGVVNAGFVLLAISILATVVLGRFFCGWACHVVAYQDLCASLLGRIGLRPRPIRSRLLMWVPLFAAVDLFVLPVLARWWGSEAGTMASWSLTWQPTTDNLWATFPGPTMALLTLFVDGFLVVWFFGAKGFCTYGCPYGALFGIAERAAPGRIRVTDACEGCGHCTATCTSNVLVHQEVAQHGMVVDPGCMRCMDCVSVCPKDALYFGFGALPHAAKAKPRKQYDFSGLEEIVMGLVFAGALFAFRNLYNAVPFLLSVGLAVIAALCVVLGARLVRNQAVSFQHWTLRDAGRWTGKGVLVLAFVSTYLGLTAHSAFVQTHMRAGIKSNDAARVAHPESPAFQMALSNALAHFEVVDRWGLVPTTELHNRMGQLYARQPDLTAAESHLRRALELDPDNTSTHAALGEVLVLAGRETEALAPYLRAVELDPGEPRAAAGLVSLLLRAPALLPQAHEHILALVQAKDQANGQDTDQAQPTPDQIEAHARLAELLVLQLEFDAAVRELDWVLTRDPAHLAARRSLAALLRRHPNHAAARSLAER